MMKKLSIIIPLYNAAAFVERAAKSVASQAFDGLEAVAVDNGCSDNSLNECLKYLPEVNTVSVIIQENAGLSAARNAGIRAASGEHVLFLDADDFLLPDALKNIRIILEKEKPDVLFGRYVMWTPARGFSKCKPFTWQPPSDPKKRTEYILSDLPEHSWNAWRYICRREFITENELFFEEGLLCEDVPWTLALLEGTKSLSFLPEPFYAYRHRRTGSLLNSQNPEWLISLNRTVKKLLKEYHNRPPICRQLIHQSFLYVNEYCTFAGRERKQIYRVYKAVLPMYKLSPSWLHHVAGKCRSPALLWGLSAVLFSIKCLRRRLRG